MKNIEKYFVKYFLVSGGIEQKYYVKVSANQPLGI